MQNIDIDLDSIVRHKTRHGTAHFLCTGEGMSYFARFTLRFAPINFIEDDLAIGSNLRTI